MFDGFDPIQSMAKMRNVLGHNLFDPHWSRLSHRHLQLIRTNRSSAIEWFESSIYLNERQSCLRFSRNSSQSASASWQIPLGTRFWGGSYWINIIDIWLIWYEHTKIDMKIKQNSSLTKSFMEWLNAIQCIGICLMKCIGQLRMTSNDFESFRIIEFNWISIKRLLIKQFLIRGA